MTMDRVLVRGCSGSGKTTMGRELSARLGVPRIELDALYHQEGWQPRDPEEFREAVAAATSGDRWVVDGNYAAAIPVFRERVDTVVWLDLPRWQVFARVLGRTLWRIVIREELWNSNRESFRNLFRTDPRENIALWTWTQWPRYHREAAAAATDPDWAHAQTFHLTSSEEVASFLADLPAG